MRDSIKNFIMAAVAGLIILSAAAFAVTPALAEGYDVDLKGQVTGVEWWDDLNVRQWPAWYSQKVGQLEPGAYVWIERCITVEDSSDWCKVERNTTYGWVNSRYLDVVVE